MREIKFRAWDKVSKDMVYEGLEYHLRILELKRTDDKEYNSFELNNTPWEKERFELMQYTGLRDRKGVEIFESDIFIDSKGDYYKVIYCNKHAAFLGECIKETFQSSDPEYQEVGETTMLYTNIEVIGNIHENPELLEVK